MKRACLNFVFLLIVLLIASCSATKYVPEGKYLLEDIKIISENKEVKTSSFPNYVRQTPNSKWFNLIKVPLSIYSLSGRDSTKWSNRFLKRIGDAPVIYDENTTSRSEEELEKVLNNMGYMSAYVETEKNISKKKIKLTYKLTPGPAYHIQSVSYDIRDKNIQSYFRNDSIPKRLKDGMIFDVNVLDNERQKITSFLQGKGYYNFNKEHISYTADTVINTQLIDLTMHIAQYRPSANEPPTEHKQYKINSISYLLDGDASKSSSLININLTDSIHYKGFPVYFRDKPFIRPKVLIGNTRMYPGNLFNEQAVENTYASFGRLRALKYTNIRFRETEVNNEPMLDCYVMLTKGKYKSVTTELEGTNSAGDLGAAASVSFQHRNIFKGSETFMIKLRGAYEAISGLQGGFSDNYTEYGVETSLNFPSFVFPFLSSNFKRKIRATSEVGIQYSSQIRPEFSRTVASASWGYKWSQRQRFHHAVDLIDINYVYNPYISDEFKEEYFTDNSLLKYSFSDLLIVRTGYSFNYSSIGRLVNNKAFQNSFSIRANIESSGNLLYGFSKLIKQEKSDNEQYEIGNIAYAQYVKGDFDFAKNFPIDERNSFAFRVGFGIAYPFGNSAVLPFEKRYFSGGANSVRGWSVRALGPGTFEGESDKINFMRQSGDIKLDLNIEYRTHLFWKLQGAAFVDAGNIWTIRNYEDQPGGQFKFNSFYKEIAVSYGLGIRFDFDFFILRFDGGLKAVNPAYSPTNKNYAYNTKKHFPLINPNFGRDFAFHFAVGYPF